MENITNDIFQLYEKLEDDDAERKLYNKFICLFDERASDVVANYDINAEMSHGGQMNGKFHLDDSQRTALHLNKMLATRKGLEPSTSSVTG